MDVPISLITQLRKPLVRHSLNLLCVVNLLSHSALLWRRACADVILLANYRHRFSQRKVHIIVNMEGIAKTLRPSNSPYRSVFSTAGSFGHSFTMAASPLQRWDLNVDPMQPFWGVQQQDFWQTGSLCAWHPPFSSFSLSSGVRGAKPLFFFVVRMPIRHFRRFRRYPTSAYPPPR